MYASSTRWLVIWLFQDTLERLYKYKHQIAIAAHKCDNLGNVEGHPPPEGSTDSPLTSKAAELNNNLSQTIVATERELSRLQEVSTLWESVGMMKAQLAEWLTIKQTRIDQLKQQPFKLHVEAAELDVGQLKVTYMSIIN